MSRSRVWVVSPFLLGALVVYVGWRLSFLGAMPRMLTQMSIDADVDSPATISVDGKTIAYVETFGDGNFLFVRDLNGNTPRRLASTEGASQPFFSPDGLWLGFFTKGELKKVPVAGGEAVLVAAIPNVFGASWAGDTILLGSDNGIIEVDGDGTQRMLTRVARGERAHRFPKRLPGSDWIVFDVWTGFGTASVEAVSAATGSRRRVLVKGMRPQYAMTGHLLYLDEGSLWAVPLDPMSATPTGTAFVAVTEAGKGFELSNDGTLVVSRAAKGDGPTLVSVMIHWHTELERLTVR